MNISISAILSDIGQKNIILPYVVIVSSIMVFFLTLLRSGGLFVSGGEAEVLFSLPLENIDIVLSKFMMIYFINMIAVIPVTVPGLIVLFLKTDISVLFLIFCFLSFLFIPLIPSCIASIIGFIIAIVASIFKGKYVRIILVSLISFMIVIFTMYFALKADKIIKIF